MAKAYKLTAKQKLFADEYIIDFNATRAAIAAGYSEKTARQVSCENLTKPNIQSAIANAMKERNERVEVNADYVLNRLVEVDQMDVADILDDHCNLLPITEWPKAWRTTISGIEVTELMSGKGDDKEQYGLLKKIKFPDKVKNLELIGKHTDVRAWNDKIELSGKVQIENLIQEISKEAGESEDDSPLPKDNL